MITLVEALNYRCLRYIRQPLDPFHVLVGPNASGKTTFLDVIAFLGRLVSDGPDAAIEERTQNFYDLVWRREGAQFELAVEARIPPELKSRLRFSSVDTVRYEIKLRIDSKTQERGIEVEYLFLRDSSKAPQSDAPPGAVGRFSFYDVELAIASKTEGNASYIGELPLVGPGDVFNARLGPRRSALANLPADESRFPVSLWLRDVLTSGAQQLVLDRDILRKSSPPGQGPGLRPGGSNLPWVIADLRQRAPERFRHWITHLQTAFPDLQDIEIIERPDDRHRYLMLVYSNGLKVPSWMASEGTLRMLALTLLAYLDNFKGLYLIEEPENGIHPTAIETMTQSLSSVYDAQVLMATHSPIVLSTVEPEQVLCFSKNEEGATEIVRGSEHPALQQWKRETSLGTLFASGVLG